MAIDAHSTPAPVDHRASLGTHGAPCRVLGKRGILSQVAKEIPDLPPSFIGAVPVPTPVLTAETATNTTRRKELYEILHPEARNGSAGATARWDASAKMADAFSKDTASRTGRSERAVQRDERGLPKIPQTFPSEFVVRHGGAGEVCSTVQQTAVADFASALHMRRALEGALDHGTARLAALGLPRLMEPGFVPLDPAAIGDALDTAIATLDVLDAAGVDLEDDGTAEPSLGWIDGKPTLSDSHDDREDEDEREPDDEGDPLDRGELDGWRRPLASCVVISPHAIAEREVRRLMVIVSPKVVPLFGGHRHV